MSPANIEIKLTPITPSRAKILDKKTLLRDLDKALRDTARTVKGDFNRTTKTWNRKPKFKIRGPRETALKREIMISTNDEIYGYVTRGTRPHLIPKTPKKVGSLAFGTKFKAKTKPRIIGSSKGFKGGKTAFAKQVKHPGSKPRDFDKEISKRRKRFLAKQVRQAILHAYVVGRGRR